MKPRILAIDLRSQMLGFAVLEGPQTLIDFGRRVFHTACARDNALAVCRKVARIITFFAPSIVVLKHTSGRNDRERLKRSGAIAAIKQEADLRSMEVIFLNRKQIYQAFRQSGKTSKYKIADLIAEIFPEVAWKLPPSRKNWQPEHHNMAIFDAISIGLAYFASIDQALEEWEMRAPDI